MWKPNIESRLRPEKNESREIFNQSKELSEKGRVGSTVSLTNGDEKFSVQQELTHEKLQISAGCKVPMTLTRINRLCLRKSLYLLKHIRCLICSTERFDIRDYHKMVLQHYQHGSEHSGHIDACLESNREDELDGGNEEIFPLYSSYIDWYLLYLSFLLLHNGWNEAPNLQKISAPDNTTAINYPSSEDKDVPSGGESDNKHKSQDVMDAYHGNNKTSLKEAGNKLAHVKCPKRHSPKRTCIAICVGHDDRVKDIVKEICTFFPNLKVGDIIGYGNTNESCISENTLIKYVTDKFLIKEIQYDPLLTKYNVIVMGNNLIERSMSSDIVLGLIKKVMTVRTEMRLVLNLPPYASCYIPLYAQYFDGLPLPELQSSPDKNNCFIDDCWTSFPSSSVAVLNETKRSSFGDIIDRAYYDSNHHIDAIRFPFCIFYLSEPCMNYIEAAAKTTISIIQNDFCDTQATNQKRTSYDIRNSENNKRCLSLDQENHLSIGKNNKNIVIFLPGPHEVEECCELIERYLNSYFHISEENKQYKNTMYTFEVLPLYYGSSRNEKYTRKRKNNKERNLLVRIICATTMAQTDSNIIRNVGYVIDCGLERSCIYKPSLNIHEIKVHPISKLSAMQRSYKLQKDKMASIGGKCYRLYPELYFKTAMYDYFVPSIQRSSLTWAILQLKSMGISNLMYFDFVEPPTVLSVTKSLETLHALGAITGYTETGKNMDGLTNRQQQIGVLTHPIGQMMAEFPAEPYLSKILFSSVFGFGSKGCVKMDQQEYLIDHFDSKTRIRKEDETLQLPNITGEVVRGGQCVQDILTIVALLQVLSSIGSFETSLNSGIHPKGNLNHDQSIWISRSKVKGRTQRDLYDEKVNDWSKMNYQAGDFSLLLAIYNHFIPVFDSTSFLEAYSEKEEVERHFNLNYKSSIRNERGGKKEALFFCEDNFYNFNVLSRAFGVRRVFSKQLEKQLMKYFTYNGSEERGIYMTDNRSKMLSVEGKKKISTIVYDIIHSTVIPLQSQLPTTANKFKIQQFHQMYYREDMEIINKCIVSGLFMHLAILKRENSDGQYQLAFNEKKIQPIPSSSLNHIYTDQNFDKGDAKCHYILFHESIKLDASLSYDISLTDGLVMKECMAVRPQDLLKIAPHYFTTTKIQVHRQEMYNRNEVHRNAKIENDHKKGEIMIKQRERDTKKVFGSDCLELEYSHKKRKRDICALSKNLETDEDSDEGPSQSKNESTNASNIFKSIIETQRLKRVKQGEQGGQSKEREIERRSIYFRGKQSKSNKGK